MDSFFTPDKAAFEVSDILLSYMDNLHIYTLKEKYRHLLDITNHMELCLYDGTCYKKTLIL